MAPRWCPTTGTATPRLGVGLEVEAEADVVVVVAVVVGMVVARAVPRRALPLCSNATPLPVIERQRCRRCPTPLPDWPPSTRATHTTTCSCCVATTPRSRCARRSIAAPVPPFRCRGTAPLSSAAGLGGCARTSKSPCPGCSPVELARKRRRPRLRQPGSGESACGVRRRVVVGRSTGCSRRVWAHGVWVRVVRMWVVRVWGVRVWV